MPTEGVGVCRPELVPRGCRWVLPWRLDRLAREERGDYFGHELWVLHLERVVEPGQYRGLGLRDRRLEELLGSLEEWTALAPDDEQDRLRVPSPPRS